MKKKKKKNPVLDFGKRKGRLRGDRLPPIVYAARKILDALGMHKVLTLCQLADELSISPQYLQSHAAKIGDEYRDHCECRQWWNYGNPETIRLFREGFYDDEQ